MKKVISLVVIGTIMFAAQTCNEWYKKMRQKYHIVGTKAGIVMDKDGTWLKIFAKGSAAIDFADEDEKEDALMEAEMKAKAQIAKFLKEDISSDEYLNNMSKKLKELNSDGKNQTTKISKKTLKVKSMAISNQAESLLKGVLILCESVDPKAKKAIVIVGVSPKTQRAADSARESMYRNHATGGTLRDNTNGFKKEIKIQGNMDASDSLDF